MNILKDWIIGVTYVSLIAGILIAVTPKGRIKHIVRIAGGMLLMIAFIKPLMTMRFGSFSSVFRAFKNDAQVYKEQFDSKNKTALHELIEKKTAAYILDKAGELGIAQCKISIALQTDNNDSIYPSEIWISAEASNNQRSALSEIIESEIGIDRESQHWS